MFQYHNNQYILGRQGHLMTQRQREAEWHCPHTKVKACSQLRPPGTVVPHGTELPLPLQKKEKQRMGRWKMTCDLFLSSRLNIMSGTLWDKQALQNYSMGIHYSDLQFFSLAVQQWIRQCFTQNVSFPICKIGMKIILCCFKDRIWQCP